LTVASHCMTHYDLDTLTEREQLEELRGSHEILQQCCPAYYPAVAYPNGAFNRATLSIAQRYYKAGFAVLLGACSGNRFAYPRLSIARESPEQLASAISWPRLRFVRPAKVLLHRLHLRRSD
jgi:peptidoglycan/xylan/chitin deacetylase (PgdA/CDA1 family)